MRSEQLRRKTPMKRTAFKRAVKVVSGKPKVMKSSQRAVNGADKVLWNALAALGCIACRLDGRFNSVVSIHHIDGRTKPGCHQKVLPLCAGHHQDGTGPDKSLIAVHPYKARFEARYGPQMDLLDEAMELLP